MLARIAAVTVLTVLAVLTATAGAQQPADLILQRVTEPPASVAAGKRFVVKQRIKNFGERARSGKLKLTLQDGPPPYAVPRRLARIPVEPLEPKKFRRYRIRLTIPLNAGAGRYRLRTCLKSQGRPPTCLVSKRFRVTAP